MGSSPIRLQAIHEHGSGKAVWTCPSALCSRAKGVDNPKIRSDGTFTKFQTMVWHVPIGDDLSQPRTIYSLPFHFPFVSSTSFLSPIVTIGINPRPWACN
jgi:hypothetical protein